MGNSDNINTGSSDETDNVETGSSNDTDTLQEAQEDNTSDVNIDYINIEDDSKEPEDEEPAAITEKPKDKKKLGVSDYIRYAVMFISICVFVFAVGKLVNIFYHYHHDRSIYESLDALAVNDNDNDSDNALPTDAEGNVDTSKIVLPQTVDYSKLKGINDDYAGWIQIPSVSISYPMVLGDDNSYYLTHSYNNEFSWSGAIFLDFRSSADFSDSNTLIYGHHMKDGSMFCSLLKYLDEDFYKSSSNYIYLYMQDKTYIYQIFNVTEQDTTNSTLFRITYSDDYTFKDYVNDVLGTKLYDTGVTCTEDDHIITLVTCKVDSNDPTRVLVQAKLVASVDN